MKGLIVSTVHDDKQKDTYIKIKVRDEDFETLDPRKAVKLIQAD